MSPSRSRRNSSRRSSILKPSKPRQALQNLNINSSSSENSPATTSKFKRRVSFAEKKHVKEFCNSVEQGTVWDTTYEEHDLSNLKIPGTFNQEEHNVHIAHKENIVVCNEENNMQVTYKEMIEEDLSTKDSDLRCINITDGIKSNDPLLSQIKINLQLENDNDIFKTTISCRNSKENLSDKISEISRLNLNNIDSNNLDTISVQDVPMDFTEIVCHAMYYDINYVQNNKLEKPLQNMSMELTQPISSCVNMLQNSQQEQNIGELNCVSQLDKSEAIADQCTSMETTVAVPSTIITNTTDRVNLSIYSPNDKIKRFNNISMEITTPVPSVLSTIEQSATNNESETCGSGLMAYINNKTTIFHDTSMEITNVVKTKTNKYLDCQLDERDRLTATEETNSQCDNEKTILSNISIEMTATVPANIHSITESQEKKEANCNVTNVFIGNNFQNVMFDVDGCKPSVDLDKTKICDNELMEFTEGITIWPKSNLANNEPIQNSFPNQWNNDGEDENINLILNNSQKVKSDIDYYKEPISANQTKVYDNEAMEFTEAITVSPKTNLINSKLVQNSSPSQWNNNNKDNDINSTSNNITICQNNLMTSAKMVSPSGIKDNFEKVTDDYESNSNNQDTIKTSSCSNMSMEITEAVMALQCHLPTENPFINGTYITESTLIENVENKDKHSINSTAPNDDVLKDLVVSSSLNSGSILNKETHITDNFSQCFGKMTAEIPVSTETENFVNVTNMALLESMQADVDVSTSKIINTPNVDLIESGKQNTDVSSKENIREKTYTLTPVLNEPSSIVISEISQNELSSHKQLQNVISNPRRTYVIQPLNTIDHYCNKDDSETTNNINNEIKNDSFCYTSNDSRNCAHSSLNGIESLKDFQNNEVDHLTEQDVIFFSNTVEELNTITPPSFVCMNDSLDLNTSVDTCKEANSDSDKIKISQTIELENISKNKYSLEDVSDFHENILKADQVPTVQIEKVNENCLNDDLRSSLKSHDCLEKSAITTEFDPFSSLMNKLRICAESDKIIWEVYHENIEKNLFVIGFISSSLLVIIYLKDHCDAISDQPIKEIKICSRLRDDADALISMVHRVILEKLDTQVLIDLCENSEDIFSLLNYISKEVKLAMDFMFDVERMRDVTLMEITGDSISFIAFGKKKDIILRVTVDIKPFDKIESKDISIYCKLGSVREEDVKRLIKNIKRDHKFLRRFINDVNDYIYLMEESVNIIKR
ncbi:uncharacterized protein LOC100883122 isoform X2 [Megachile rotundata]|uniref:uncharacterized protein LOC100883122 isoform X2 n=1 Tax=Megachile rotundata TaxID=143995 RepID=UPI000614B08B|nr:PREDICTED: protein PF14_0175-like isoform X1 [Megachile rotundata]